MKRWAVLTCACALVACGRLRNDPDAGAGGGSAGGGSTGGGGGGGVASCALPDAGFSCDGVTGLCAPITACSTAAPCPRTNGAPVTTTFVVPTCRTAADAGRPLFDDGPARTWLDTVTGEQRAACVFRPDAGFGLRPLVLFLHGSSGEASDVYDFTSLRQKAVSYPLTDAGPPGFVLAANQGRFLPNPNGNLGPETRHDIYFRRDFSSASGNPDYRNVDRLVDELVAQGGIDPRRIYAMGWSNGAFFAQQWALVRYIGPTTPGGNRVAGAVAFAGGDPFQNLSANTVPTCAYGPSVTSGAPIFNIRRSCDSAVACDAAQHQKFGQPPGYDIAAWVQRLRGPFANPNVVDVIIDADGMQRSTCTLAGLCTRLGGLINHVRWPDGVADNGGRDWEPAMLDFLGSKPLP